MAVPKKKTTKSKRNQRRASNWKIILPEITTCPNCNEPVKPYHICQACGFYKEKKFLEIKT